MILCVLWTYWYLSCCAQKQIEADDGEGGGENNFFSTKFMHYKNSPHCCSDVIFHVICSCYFHISFCIKGSMLWARQASFCYQFSLNDYPLCSAFVYMKWLLKVEEKNLGMKIKECDILCEIQWEFIFTLTLFMLKCKTSTITW